LNKINWEEIYKAYTVGIQTDTGIEFPTLDDLSKKYNISAIAIRKHSAKEKWTEAREQFLKDTRQKSQQKVVEKISEELIPFDTDVFKEAKRILEELKSLHANNPYNGLILVNTLKSLIDLKKTVAGEGGKDNEPIQIVVKDEETKRMVEKVLNGND
jgi:hypothetical protein